MSRILLVEDEPAMQAGLRENLEIEGYEVDVAGDGREGLEKLTAGSYDLAVLDVMLPRMSGFDILKSARQQGIQTPAIMLTAKGEELDKVLGLELGADDYITKPFSLREFLARVKAVLRRATSGPLTARAKIGPLDVDFTSYSATRDGAPIDLTAKEFDILKFLWDRRNQNVTRDQLLTDVWGYDEPLSTRTVDNFILRLRQKMEDDPAHPRIILTIHGIGYKLVSM
jgi:DNA-binding response OmpR family regulator